MSVPWRNVVSQTDGGAWSISQFLTPDGMQALREKFPHGKADELNFVLFSTSGVSGSYTTIEESQAAFMESGGLVSVTFVIVAPRIIRLEYGNCQPESAEDYAFLKSLRETSWAAVAGIGRQAV